MAAPPEYRSQPFGLSKCQLHVFLSEARFRVLVAGRRFGKTQLALVELLKAAYQPGALAWYIAPSYRLAKRVVWQRLKTLTRPYWAGFPSETELVVTLRGGGKIMLCGADQPGSLRGNGLSMAALDEYASMRPECWSEVIRPSLADTQGRALFIGTPHGCNHFYERYEQAKETPNWEAFHFTTLDGGRVTPEELAQSALDLDLLTYQQEFEAEFSGVNQNRVYYAFKRANNVNPVAYDVTKPLIWTLDFNINPMSALLLQRHGDQIHVIDEIVIASGGNTARACQLFRQRTANYPQNGVMKVDVYGDVSGNHRSTSSPSTDYTIIREFFDSWKGTYLPSVKVGLSNPAVHDRVNCLNARLENVLGDYNLFIDPKCKELIKDLELVKWAVDTTGLATEEIDKSDRTRTHLSDALGYYVAQIFGLRGKFGDRPQGRIV